MIYWIAIIGVVLLLGLWVATTYNKLVTKRNRVDNAWGQIDVQLQRRYDLIPNLVETVKGYASHESETFEQVTKARSASAAAQTPGEQAQADNFLTSALRQLFAVAEAYPELRASENFASLQSDLSETENKIAISRQIYNDTVLTYNTSIQQVPTNLVAAVTGFTARETYDAVSAADEAPEVNF
jgi:LemA protein